MQEIWVWSLGWKDPLEKEMATHADILAWRIPWTEEPGGLQPIGLQRAGCNRETDGMASKLSSSVIFLIYLVHISSCFLPM